MPSRDEVGVTKNLKKVGKIKKKTSRIIIIWISKKNYLNFLKIGQKSAKIGRKSVANIRLDYSVAKTEYLAHTEYSAEYSVFGLPLVVKQYIGLNLTYYKSEEFKISWI